MKIGEIVVEIYLCTNLEIVVHILWKLHFVNESGHCRNCGKLVEKLYKIIKKLGEYFK